ncbi:MAG: ABC-2 transporter permease [Clostridiales Family XIII bacterium]|jgi:hypothetical protein|nr:ABC-2 transporter permease [Clostridiales Family XIII bacterium]
MKALILKDIRMLIPNLQPKVIFFLIALILIPTMIFGFALTLFVLTFLLFFLLYLVQMIDERTKFEEYALTFPISRAGYVRIKYVELGAVFLASVALMLLDLVLINALGNSGNNSILIRDTDFGIVLQQTFGSTFFVFFIPTVFMILLSLIYPVVMKIGMQRGQIVFLIGLLFLPVFGVQTMTMWAIDIIIKIEEGDFHFPHALGFALPVLAIAAFLISYAVSLRIVKNRDF